MKILMIVSVLMLVFSSSLTWAQKCKMSGREIVQKAKDLYNVDSEFQKQKLI